MRKLCALIEKNKLQRYSSFDHFTQVAGSQEDASGISCQEDVTLITHCNLMHCIEWIEIKKMYENYR